MNKETLINNIDEFMYDFDPYDYHDQESYTGENKEKISELVNNNEFKDIKVFLKEVIQEDRDINCTKKAKKLLNEINKTSQMQR